MREFIIVHMIDQIEDGARFTMWPLHITILTWFDAPDADRVTDVLPKQLSGFTSLEVATGEEALFGPAKSLPVTLINNTPELQVLHEGLLEMIRRNNWPLRGRYTGKLFKPHVTQKAGRKANGKFTINRLHIVEKQGQGYRQVIGKVDLPV